MTIPERNMILNNKFEDIWNYVWLSNDNSINKNNKEFINSKIKFYTLNENNFLKNYIISIKIFIMNKNGDFQKAEEK